MNNRHYELTQEDMQYYKKHGFDVEGNVPILLPDAFNRKDCLNELRPGEIWLANIDIRKKQEYLSRKKVCPTLRIGEQAYAIDGEPIARFDSRPLFIHKSEEIKYDNYLTELRKKEQDEYNNYLKEKSKKDDNTRGK